MSCSEFTAKLSQLTDVGAETDENIAHVSWMEGVVFYGDVCGKEGIFRRGLFIIRVDEL